MISLTHAKKRLYFGRDADGVAQPVPTANGPDMKVILRHESLLPRTMDIMAEVWELTEPLRKEEGKEPSGKAGGKRKKGEQPTKGGGKKAKPKKSYPARFDEVEASEDEGDDAEKTVPQAPTAHPRGRARVRPTRSVR